MIETEQEEKERAAKQAVDVRRRSCADFQTKLRQTKA